MASRSNCGAVVRLAALLLAVCVVAFSPSVAAAEETHSTVTYNPVEAFLSMLRDSQTSVARETTEAPASRVFLPMLFPPPIPPQPQNVYHKHVHHLPKKPPTHVPPFHPPSHRPHPHPHKPHHPHHHHEYPPFFPPPPQPRYY
ncbi:hypothetical protein BESB_028620 [Besnoitia besnoiti]|uniref:Transmembrane protein n=1 Tax=Besnoitia besnoiti TaxID=94643 RepID=A0A2A9M716_BESBE|nr:uncharacterized protein BESB_028620 [Besnoitia besnoiti]PFH31427.1 hypothetical protein BESB_028620 [Besnoitia besnoiti]